MQSIGSVVMGISAGDYLEIIARQTSGSTKNVAADELTWFAIEVVEWGITEPLNNLPYAPPRHRG